MIPKSGAYIFLCPHSCKGGQEKCVGPTWSRKGGFTLVELVIVLAIVAILAVIALQIFAHYRVKAFDITVKYDLRNFRTAQEIYSTSHGGGYLGDLGESIGLDGQPNDLGLLGFVASNGVRFSVTSSPTPVIVEGSHLKSSTIYEYDFTNDILTRNP